MAGGEKIAVIFLHRTMAGGVSSHRADYQRVYPRKMGGLMGFNGGLMGFNGGLMGFNGISWDLMGYTLW